MSTERLAVLSFLCGQLSCFLWSTGPAWLCVIALATPLVWMAALGVSFSPRLKALRAPPFILAGFLSCMYGTAQRETSQEQIRALSQRLSLQETERSLAFLVSGPSIFRQEQCNVPARLAGAGDQIIDLRFKARSCVGLKPGDLVRCPGTFKPWPAALNPGQADLQDIMWRKGKAGKFRCRWPPVLVAPAAALVPWRERILGALYRNLERAPMSADSRGLIMALVVGERSALDLQVRDNFRISGCAHLLALSGFHLGIGFLVTLYVVRALLFPFLALPSPLTVRLPFLAGALVALLQTILAGCPPSCVRALSMVTYFSLSRVVPRPHDKVSNLALSACVNCLLDAWCFRDAGFQLSTAATAAIIFCPQVSFAGHLTGRTAAAASYLASLLGMSLAASAVTMPLLALHFGRVQPLGPVLSLPLLILFTCSLPVYGLALFVQHLPAGVLALPAAIWDLLSFVFTAALDAVAAASFEYPVSLADTASLLLAGAGTLLLLARRLRPGVLLLAAALLTVPAGRLLSPPAAPAVHFFSCGDGNATLLQLPGAGNILLDAGPAGCGRNVLRPFLARHGIRQLDLGIVTHSHADHYLGLLELAPEFSVSRLLLPDTPTGRALGPLLASVAPVVEYQAAPSTKIPLDDGSLTLLAPAALKPGLAENDSSMQVFLTLRGQTLFFAADLGENGWRAVADQIPHDQVDLLQIPHHGRPSPVFFPMVSRLNPRILFTFTSGDHLDGGFFKSLLIENDPERSTWFSHTDGYCMLLFRKPSEPHDCIADFESFFGRKTCLH